VLSGTVHQGSVQFVGSFSGASSCITNSVVPLAVSQTNKISCWKASIIDGILGIGMQLRLYKDIFPNRCSKDLSPYLQFEDLFFLLLLSKTETITSNDIRKLVALFFCTN
jgi:hypothetical protein